MAYLLKQGEQVTVNGRTFNGDTRAYVKSVILDREQKMANIIFKIYWGNKEFELQNNNYIVNDTSETNEAGETIVKNYFTDYFDSAITEAGLTVMEYMKAQAYKLINDKVEVIGAFEKSKWQADE